MRDHCSCHFIFCRAAFFTCSLSTAPVRLTLLVLDSNHPHWCQSHLKLPGIGETAFHHGELLNSFGLALAGWLRTKRRRVIQWSPSQYCRARRLVQSTDRYPLVYFAHHKAPWQMTFLVGCRNIARKNLKTGTFPKRSEDHNYRSGNDQDRVAGMMICCGSLARLPVRSIGRPPGVQLRRNRIYGDDLRMKEFH